MWGKEDPSLRWIMWVQLSTYAFFVTYDIYYLHQNQNVLNTIILLTFVNNFESTCMEDMVNMYISFESFSLCCCPGPTDLLFERRSWRTKSLDNGQIIGLGILKTWGAMEGWAPTSGKLWETKWEKVVQNVWVLGFRMRKRVVPDKRVWSIERCPNQEHLLPVSMRQHIRSLLPRWRGVLLLAQVRRSCYNSQRPLRP